MPCGFVHVVTSGNTFLPSNVFAMFKSKDVSASYLAIRYSLEFVVVVLGISVSFWLSEWSQNRKELQHHSKDAIDLLEDLALDSQRLDMVQETIERGKAKTWRLLENHKLLQEGVLVYDQFADSLVAIGYPYGYTTFFMNNATYKSLISNGRLQHFPTDIEKEIKDYYEYVSKRVEDNNEIIDQLCLDYYNEHHTMCLLSDSSNFLSLGEEDAVQKAREFVRIPSMEMGYSSPEFFKATIAMRHRILVHELQIDLYMDMRDRVDQAVRQYMEQGLLDYNPDI